MLTAILMAIWACSNLLLLSSVIAEFRILLNAGISFLTYFYFATVCDRYAKK